MTSKNWTWLVIAAVWGLFFSWYTSFGGPLTDEEKVLRKPDQNFDDLPDFPIRGEA